MKFLYLKGIDVFGPFEAEEIAKESCFSPDLLVCPEEKAEQEAAWKPVSRYEEFKSFLEKGTIPLRGENQVKKENQIIDSEISFSPQDLQNQGTQNTSQDLPVLEDTETNSSAFDVDNSSDSFNEIMGELSTKNEEHKEENVEEDHTFLVANKEDNLLEDLPAHSLLGPDEDQEPLPSKELSSVSQEPLRDSSANTENIKEMDSVKGNRDLLEISNNKIISSSDGRVKKKKSNDLLFILSFLVLMIVAIALCMAFWNMMNGGRNIQQEPSAQSQNTLQSSEAKTDNSLMPEISEQKNKELSEEEILKPKLSLEEQVIDIVKNTQLTNNRGTIGDYLNKVYGDNYQSSWSTKPFTENVYIVEFFASQVRSEPFVYLFRVDIDQKKITGALNNITLDLLA